MLNAIRGLTHTISSGLLALGVFGIMLLAVAEQARKPKRAPVTIAAPTPRTSPTSKPPGACLTMPDGTYVCDEQRIAQ